MASSISSSKSHINIPHNVRIAQVQVLQELTDVHIKKKNATLAKLNVEKNEIEEKIKNVSNEIYDLEKQEKSFVKNFYANIKGTKFNSGIMNFLDDKLKEFRKEISEQNKIKNELQTDLTNKNNEISEIKTSLFQHEREKEARDKMETVLTNEAVLNQSIIENKEELNRNQQKRLPYFSNEEP